MLHVILNFILFETNLKLLSIEFFSATCCLYMTIIKYLLHNIKPNTPKAYEGDGYKANVQIIPKVP